MLEPEINYSRLTNAELDWVQDGSAGIVKLTEVTTPSGTASGVGVLYVKSSDSKLYYQDDSGTETEIGSGSGAPTDAQYVVLAANGSLSAERILTGTSNQLIITDGGAGNSVTLSTPQDLHSTTSLRVGTIKINGSGLTLAGTTNISSFGTTFVNLADASAARTNLGLVIGTDVQAFDAQLSDIAGLTPTASTFIAGNGSNFVSRTAAQVRGDLTLVVGTDVQAYDTQLADIAGLTPTASTFIVGNGSNYVSRTASQVRSDLTLHQKSVGMLIYDPNTSMSSGTAKAFFTVPAELNGWKPNSAHAEVYGTAATTAVIIDMNHEGVSMFSTRLFIDAAEQGSDTSATAVVLYGTAVATNDRIDYDIDQANTATKGLFVRMLFQQP